MGENALGIFIQNIRDRKWKIGLSRLLFSAIYVKNREYNNIRYHISKIFNKIRYHKLKIHDYEMYVDLNDEGISKDLYNIKGREFFSSQYVSRIIQPDEIILDIGANIGYYALMEGSLARSGKVYALEPIVSNYDLLLRNIALNQYKNITPYRYAIGDQNGEGEMYVYDKCNWCSFTKTEETQIIGTISVPILTIDTFVDNYMEECPTFIRMDVEGYENSIFKGAKQTVKKSQNLKLCIEIHPTLMSAQDLKEMITFLKDEVKFDIAAIFLEVEPWNYKDVDLLNWLKRVMGITPYGPLQPNYATLDAVLKEGCFPVVFFEKHH